MKIALLGQAIRFEAASPIIPAFSARPYASRMTYCSSPETSISTVAFSGKKRPRPKRSADQLEEIEYLIDSLNPLTWSNACRRITEYRPDIVIFPWWTAFWTPHFWYIATTLKRRLPIDIVVICHNVQEHEPNPLKTFAAKTVLGRADRLITHSEQDTERLRRLLGSSIPITTAFSSDIQRAAWSTLPRKRLRKKSLAFAGRSCSFLVLSESIKVWISY